MAPGPVVFTDTEMMAYNACVSAQATLNLQVDAATRVLEGHVVPWTPESS